MTIANPVDSLQQLSTTSSVSFSAVTAPALNSGTGANETITLGDAAGVNKLSIKDSASAEVSFIDSNGNGVLLESLTIGQDEVETSFTISGVATTAKLSIDSEGTDALAEAVIHRHNSTGSYGAYEVLLRSRGTHASPTIVQNGDGLGTVFFGGYDGSNYSLGGLIQCDVSGTPGANDMPTQMIFGTTKDGANFPTTALSISAAQAVNIPAGSLTVTSQPAFVAYPNATITDVTGDGTTYTLICNTAPVNVGTVYNTSTGTFTAPIAGTYLFNGSIGLSGLLVGHTELIIIVNTSPLGAFRPVRCNPYTSSTSTIQCFPFSWTGTMSASGTMTVQVLVSGGTKVVDIFGDTSNFPTFISGTLLC